MGERHGPDMFREKIKAGNLVCVGLDGDMEKLPQSVLVRGNMWVTNRNPLFLFLRAIVDATHDIAGAYKPNTAFFEAYGSMGMAVLEQLVVYIKVVAPDVPIIGDAKRGDIASSNAMYAQGLFDYIGFDGITVSPYPGLANGLEPLLNRPDKLAFVLARTSNDGATEFQDRLIGPTYGAPATKPIWQYVVGRVATRWNVLNNCGVIVGATYPDDLAWVRQAFGDLPILSPGLGRQGGDLQAAARAGTGFTTFNSSGSVLYASSDTDFAEAARMEVARMNTAIVTARTML